mmetsp:Transcript_12043/g.27323  ORF Transcript_12043/g.27323 Transcript_12043/m.27323 type:complete len:89 (-) Transcript_12043:45-311(-)
METPTKSWHVRLRERRTEDTQASTTSTGTFSGKLSSTTQHDDRRFSTLLRWDLILKPWNHIAKEKVNTQAAAYTVKAHFNIGAVTVSL